MTDNFAAANSNTEHQVSGAQTDGDATFELPADDPRRVDNRGGLEATVDPDRSDTPSGSGTNAAGSGPANLGTTGANVTDTAHDVGAQGTGLGDSGQVDLKAQSFSVSREGPAGVGPVEGSASGATVPHIEMTDVGLVDVNAVDMSLPDDGTTGARVVDENGNVL